MNIPSTPAIPGVDGPVVPNDLLRAFDAVLVRLDRGETLFEQGDRAISFHQVAEGKVKMAVMNDRGREFVQGYFTSGQSFGEPPFFLRGSYPASAVAVERSSVYRIRYEDFLRLLSDHPEICLRVTEVLSARLLYKAMMLGEIAVEEAEHRLSTIIEYFRGSESPGSVGEYRVPFTRQQLADMTGLRVETVIRTIKGMEESGVLRIEDGKIIWRP